MLNNPVVWHILPVDGNFFDDTEQTIASVVTLNLIVLALFVICLISIKNGRRAAAHEAKLEKLKQAIQPPLIEIGADQAGSSPSTRSKKLVETAVRSAPARPARAGHSAPRKPRHKK